LPYKFKLDDPSFKEVEIVTEEDEKLHAIIEKFVEKMDIVAY
jgi:hypothetical protein